MGPVKPPARKGAGRRWWWARVILAVVWITLVNLAWPVHGEWLLVLRSAGVGAAAAVFADLLRWSYRQAGSE